MRIPFHVRKRHVSWRYFRPWRRFQPQRADPKRALTYYRYVYRTIDTDHYAIKCKKCVRREECTSVKCFRWIDDEYGGNLTGALATFGFDVSWAKARGCNGELHEAQYAYDWILEVFYRTFRRVVGFELAEMVIGS